MPRSNATDLDEIPPLLQHLAESHYRRSLSITGFETYDELSEAHAWLHTEHARWIDCEACGVTHSATFEGCVNAQR